MNMTVMLRLGSLLVGLLVKILLHYYLKILDASEEF